MLEYEGNLHERGARHRSMSYSEPIGGKQNLHADGHGQDADTLLAVLGNIMRDKHDRPMPSAVFMVVDAAMAPFTGEYVLIPCRPGSVICMAGKLANGGDGTRQGAKHGKLPVPLAASDMGAPHLVMSCKRFFLLQDRPIGGAIICGVGVNEFSPTDPLRFTFYRRNIIGRVACADAYPPNLEVVRRDGLVWEQRGTMALHM
eukprot:gene22106-26638_t